MTARLLTQTQLEQLVNEAQARFPADDRLTVAEWVAYLDNQDMIEKVGDKYRLSGKITQEDVRDALYASGGHRLYSNPRRNPSPEEHLDGAKHYLTVSMERARAGDLWKAYDFTMLAYSQAIDAAEYRAEGADEMLRKLRQRSETLKSQLVAQLSGGGGKVSNPSTKQHIEFAQDCLDLATRLEASAGARNDPDELWRAYDEATKGIAHIEGLIYTMTEAKTPAEALALKRKCETKREALWDKIRYAMRERATAELTGRPSYYDLLEQGGKVSNPRHGGAHYFVVLDKKGKQQFYTQTAAEARELLASNAKVRGGSYKHL